MIVHYNLLPYIIAGIALITLLDTAGAIASRKFNFNYGFLSPISFIIYTATAYLVAKNNSFDLVLSCNVLIGLYDAIIGWNVSMKLKPNTGKSKEQLIEVTEGQRIFVMTIIAAFFAFIGYMIANNVTL